MQFATVPHCSVQFVSNQDHMLLLNCVVLFPTTEDYLRQCFLTLSMAVAHMQSNAHTAHIPHAAPL